MATLVTVQEIVDYLNGLMGSGVGVAPVGVAPVGVAPVVPGPVANGGAAPVVSVASVVVPVAAPVVPVPVSVPAAVSAGADVMGEMLAVVADKTGYPVEMLDLSMALEADLGIDSIKRVEILSAVQERIPSLPEVETSVMATLVTVQEIVDYLDGLLGPATFDGAPPSQAAPPGTIGVAAGERLPFELAGVAIARHTVGAIAAPASGMGMVGLYGATVEIVAPTQDQAPIAHALSAILRTHGITATAVAAPSADARAVIHLGGLGHVGTRADALALNRLVFDDARSIAAGFAARGGVFVTVQDTGGTFGLITDPGDRAWTAGIAALAKTAAQEWPTAEVKTIDIEVGSQSAIEVAERLANELLTGGVELEVGLSSTHGRVTVAARAEQVVTHTPRLDSSDVIVVSGGARGVTAASVIALARQNRAAFVLIGRTELAEEPSEVAGAVSDADIKRALLARAAAQGIKLTPRVLESHAQRIQADREVRGTLAALTAAGSRVRYAALDVRDAAQLGALLESVRAELGPITGLVHGAGVLADAPLHKKTLDGFDRVFETKVGGLSALLDATADDPLKLVCLFSSVAARSGNPGQSDYAMANEILNKVALAEQARRGPGCLVRALGWGPWDSGMVTPGLKAMFESRGISLIPVEAGAHAFVADVLDAETGRAEVILGEGVTAGLPTHPIPPEGRIARVLAHVSRQPYLLGHRIQGNVVLPIVQVIKWFVAMAMACRPGYRADRIAELKVLRGVTLHQFDGPGEPLLLRCRPIEGAPDRLAFTLSDTSDTVMYYSATVEMSSGAGAGPSLDATRVHVGLNGSRHIDRDTCYTNGALFHGPAFQVLTGMDCRESDATAWLYGLSAAGWEGQDWPIDPAALDGCLQAALVWSFDRLGRKVLPLKVGEVINYRGGALGEGLRCELSNADASASRVICDLDLVDADNHVVASLKRLELYPYGG